MTCLAGLLVILAGDLLIGPPLAMAQQSPPPAFGSSAEREASPPPAFGERSAAMPDTGTRQYQSRFDRVIGWITTEQQKIQRRLAEAIRDLREGNPLYAALVLAGLSFGYGVLHAAGPGHGKTIITSYVVANEETARRGILVSFLAAALQAMTAVVLVLLLAVAFNATGFELKTWSSRLETTSYAFIAIVGVWLLMRQLRKLLFSGKRNGEEPAPQHGHSHAVDHHNHPHDHAHAHNHAHGHAHCETCGHMPDLQRLAQPLKVRQIAAVVLSVGIRPCTGAIVVLAFALAQGLLWAGIAATFAMAFGTALTVASIAILALFSRELALKLGGEGGRWGEIVWATCGLGGSVIIILFGAILFLASLGPARPF